MGIQRVEKRDPGITVARLQEPRQMKRNNQHDGQRSGTKRILKKGRLGIV